MKKSKKNLVCNCLIVLLILIAVGSGIYLFVYYYNINTASKGFESLKDEIQEDYLDEDGEEIYIEIEEEPVFKKYASLYSKNSDLIGWLKIDDTVIDYPVMYTPDDGEYYLRRDFDKEYSTSGTLFVDADCIPTGEDVSDNIIIYGHNMKAGTMFHTLLEYEDEEFYKEHKYISFDTIYGEGTYEVIAAFRTRVYSKDDTEHYNFYDFTDAGSEEEFNEYVNNAKSETPYIISESAAYGDKLLTLSTCSYHASDGRFIVVAKKIDTEETE